jgi:lipopolysaccharide/colanic/teichoic acid biosynthesis glycosyltransferase
LVVKATSAGPVLYRGVRTGLKGRDFKQLKFRSMTVGAGGAAFTARGDPRVTAVGRIRRFAKLDELPQLFNVLRGEMSIVGPRPEDAAVVRTCYTREHLRVLSVRPGMTGLLQVRIFPDFTRDVPDNVDSQEHYLHTILPARIKEDLEYVDRMSIWLDLKAILLTIYCILIKSWFVLWRRRKSPMSAEVV